jgi:hypothetical protein
MLLATGRKIVRHTFIKMPITESVIKELKKWASKDCALTGLTFMNKYGIEFKSDKEEADTTMEEKQLKWPLSQMCHQKLPA